MSVDEEQVWLEYHQLLSEEHKAQMDKATQDAKRKGKSKG
jgi:hypothetical protein